MWGWQTAFLFRDSQSVCQLRGSMSKKKRKATNQIHQIAEICQVLAVGFRTMFHIFSLLHQKESSTSPYESCSKCLTSWHQIRKCLCQCLRFAYMRTGFAYAHILSYADLTLADAHHSFAYATPLPRGPLLNMNTRV